MNNSLTLKVHVILDHYMWYFKEMGTNFHDTNGEYVKAVHYSLEGHENTRYPETLEQMSV